MTTKSKMLFADELNYSGDSRSDDYGKIKLKSADSLKGGLIKMVLAYIYFFTLASGVIILLTK